MFYQSEEINVTVFINGEMVPAVTQVDIDLEHAIVDSQVDRTKKKYLVTITRYLPVGVEVNNLYTMRGFNVTVNDSWLSFALFECEWTNIKRHITADGVVETSTLLAASFQAN